MSLHPLNATRLEKAAVDNGFDLECGRDGDWLIFASSHASLQIWLTTPVESLFLLALSRTDVSETLNHTDPTPACAAPKAAAAVLSTNNLQTLHRIIRRAFQLARALPDEPLKAFLHKTANLPRLTEAERLVVQRIGQGIFRDRLLDYWEGRCAITGLMVPELLRASHIKPWARCETDAERLDVFNGLLLAPHLDAVFDRGFISVANDGEVVVTDTLDHATRQILNLTTRLRIAALTQAHRNYLSWHRNNVFQHPGREP